MHLRINIRHPEISDVDVAHAWTNSIRFFHRVDKDPNEYIAVGADRKNRLLEIVGVRLQDGTWLLYHATSPPSQKTLKTLGLVDERK